MGVLVDSENVALTEDLSYATYSTSLSRCIYDISEVIFVSMVGRYRIPRVRFDKGLLPRLLPSR